MSNYCKACRYDPRRSSGGDACPVTTFYWDFFDRNYDKIKDNHRMLFQVRNYERKSSAERAAISKRADELRRSLR